MEQSWRRGRSRIFRIQNNPGKMNPAVIRAYGQVIQTVLTAAPANPAKPSGGSSLRLKVLLGALAVILLVAAVAAFIYLRRLLGKRSSGDVTPTMQMTEINREAEKNKTDFQPWELRRLLLKT